MFSKIKRTLKACGRFVKRAFDNIYAAAFWIVWSAGWLMYAVWRTHNQAAATFHLVMILLWCLYLLFRMQAFKWRAESAASAVEFERTAADDWKRLYHSASSQRDKLLEMTKAVTIEGPIIEAPKETIKVRLRTVSE